MTAHLVLIHILHYRIKPLVGVDTTLKAGRHLARVHLLHGQAVISHQQVI